MPRGPLPAPPSLGDVPRDPAERAHFARVRLSLFGKTVFWIAVTFLALSVFLHLVQVMSFWRPGMECHLLATAIALLMWRAPLSRSLPASVLPALDTLGTLGMCVNLTIMGYRYGQDQPWGSFAGILAVFHVTMARAIIVPSTALRTCLVTGESFLGLVVAQMLLQRSSSLPGALPGWLALVPQLTWSATITALATLASKVIYGLQERVFEAQRLGQYTLEEKIGEGGMGEVYRASHAMLRRPTAVKLISGNVDDLQLRRFEREVQLTARLNHPNTISIYDYGRTPEGTFYYAMELLNGLTLEQLVERHGPQAPPRVIHILLQICGALREAHDAGLIHRDIKPANAILCQHGGLPDVVKVLDFGLVKQIAGNARASLSHSEAIVGTPLFMSPEEISTPGAVEPRSDLYSLGAVGYYLLCGEPVFKGTNVIEVCGHHLHSSPPPLSTRSDRAIPGDLEAIVMGCLAKQPDARPPSAHELAQRLRTCADAGSWSEADARAWWRAQEDHVPLDRPRDASGDSRLLRVDLETRSRVERV